MAIAQEASVPATQAVVPPKTDPEELQGWASVKHWFSAQLSSDETPIELHFGKSKYLIPRKYLVTLYKPNDGTLFVRLDYHYPSMSGSETDGDLPYGPYNPNLIQVFVGLMGSADIFDRTAVTPVAVGNFTEAPYGLKSSPDHRWTFHSNLYVDLREPKQDSIVIDCPDESVGDLTCRSSYEAPGGLNVLIEFDKRLLPGWKKIVDTVHADLSRFYAGELP